MKTLSESATSILQAVTTAEVKPAMPAVGLTQQGAGDGMMIIPHHQPSLPATVEEIRTANFAIESMQQQGKLTISSVKHEKKIPVRDTDGEIIRWEFDLVDSGKTEISVSDLDLSEIEALKFAASPGHKSGIHAAIERLAQIKPIGRSDVKQAVVISTLVFDLVKMGASEIAVVEVCTEARRSTESDFFPKFGQFLDAVEARMNVYKTAYLQALSKDTPQLEDHTQRDPIGKADTWGKTWGELTESQREQMLNRGKK